MRIAERTRVDRRQKFVSRRTMWVIGVIILLSLVLQDALSFARDGFAGDGARSEPAAAEAMQDR